MLERSRRVLAAITATAFLAASAGPSLACTVLLIKDVNGNAYKGRTLEFSTKMPTLLTMLPAGTVIESATPTGAKGVSFKTKFPIVGMTIHAVETSKQTSVIDGANDQGLSVTANAQNGTGSPQLGKDDSKIMSGSDFGAWALGSFKTVAEVKKALADIRIWMPVTPVMGNAPMPVHYAVFDKTGAGIVVEFLNNSTQVYDNPVGVMTNGAAFPWHLENLNTYTFTNVDKNTGQLGSLKLETPDAGVALRGLPSDETAVGRFVKAAFYANYVRKASTPDDAIKTLSHIMNNFDRPMDLTVDEGAGSGDGARTKGVSSEVTYWTVMADLSRGLYYVRSINSLEWSVIDVSKLKDVKAAKSLSSYDVDALGRDATSYFTK